VFTVYSIYSVYPLVQESSEIPPAPVLENPEHQTKW
jgi:hypothetical protein